MYAVIFLSSSCRFLLRLTFVLPSLSISFSHAANDMDLEGRKIRVNLANAKADPSPGTGAFYGKGWQGHQVQQQPPRNSYSSYGGPSPGTSLFLISLSRPWSERADGCALRHLQVSKIPRVTVRSPPFLFLKDHSDAALSL
jgi:hypothetical protein